MSRDAETVDIEDSSVSQAEHQGPPEVQLGTPAGAEQKVTWLELFFDLIFVVAFDQLAKRLGDSHTTENIVVFGVLFVAIWWSWSTNALFAARYGNQNRAYRWGTLLELISMALIALTLRGDLKDTGAFCALGFGLNRLLHAGLHLWVSSKSQAVIGFARRLALSSGIAAVLWFSSAALTSGSALQVGLWCLALLIEVLTPVLVRQKGEKALPHEGHLPERVGLLQIIAMGGVVNEIVGGGRRQALSWHTLWPAFLALVTLVSLWRLYFDQARALPLLSARLAGRQGAMLTWLFAHLPFTLSLVMLGVGLGHGIGTGSAKEVAVQQQFAVWSLALALASLEAVRLISYRVVGWKRLARSDVAALVAAAAVMGLALLDLDVKQLDLILAGITAVLAFVVATDPATQQLGRIEAHVTEELSQQAEDDDPEPSERD